LRATGDTGTKLADVDGLANLSGYFGVRVEAGADCFVEFADDAIDRSFLVQPLLLSQSIRDSLDGQLWQMLRSQPAHILVARALEELLPSGHATIEAVAAHLAIGQRTLQRRLQDENTCFRSVLFATRQQLAQKYKRIGGLRQAEIAQRLGFQDVNSYYRVARLWRDFGAGGQKIFLVCDGGRVTTLCQLLLALCRVAGFCDNEWQAKEHHHHPQRVVKCDKGDIKAKNQRQQSDLIQPAGDEGQQ
jgi:AraC-like DNA-binding protein